MPDFGSHLIRTDHRLAYEQPYDYAAVLDFLALRQVAGIESVAGNTYRRTFCLQGVPGIFEVTDRASESCLDVAVWTADEAHVPEILLRVARIFGVKAAPRTALAVLGQDPLLGPLTAARPGLRIPGAWDAFEVAVRAVTGQQVTLQAATAMVGRAARICGTELNSPHWADLGLTRLFPLPAQLAVADLFDVGMPSQRMASLRSLAHLAATEPEVLSPEPLQVRRLLSQPGIGDWTAQYIAMRAHGDQDAFPAADVVIRRMLTGEGEAKPSPAAVLRRAEAWRPYRAWAVIHLWTASAAAEGSRRAPARAATA